MSFCYDLAVYELGGTDYLLEIEHNNVGILDWRNVPDLYEQGYLQTKNKLKNYFQNLFENNLGNCK